ncbi:hypothetical protein GF339_01725 [candidate division KSB3 bacterium]|uniref:Uncharacterized protein n=1 Tax=candidate division KSB3 bacterium TaxID=2044937 RepID=A0A9D5JS76_9BACT|nr:hypothetical protein [candidate division KSB3 bacterium]MBD3323270.1 hypothetical protein [candidate division KSB3 bacterium]
MTERIRVTAAIIVERRQVFIGQRRADDAPQPCRVSLGAWDLSEADQPIARRFMQDLQSKPGA